MCRPLASTLFPYTTLFRSRADAAADAEERSGADGLGGAQPALARERASELGSRSRRVESADRVAVSARLSARVRGSCDWNAGGVSHEPELLCGGSSPAARSRVRA